MEFLERTERLMTTEPVWVPEDGPNGDGEHTCQECSAELQDGLRCQECGLHQRGEWK
jgi:hypothetical protein